MMTCAANSPSGPECLLAILVFAFLAIAWRTK